ncbi:Arginine utilization regulatory protein RocR [Thalassoglobus neptunius]|uniref:Arginine utilization regulatory protein RocR n=1 Tax=Thalassoglobus neptunius TaxID=1938619 RepID=A0A5C5WQA9_9PLAN|nr:sigma 54-interacting transcriptional regulator [Thalassoglobus neptunius]TWT52233.1 Arginine utilization regulatory protein RocR [Thalassoglobus neptunius]
MSKRAKRGLATWLTRSTLPIFVLDDRNVLLVFNRGCEELTEWPASEMIGRKCEYIAVANSALPESVTGALCPPNVLESEISKSVLTVIPSQSGKSSRKRIEFFPLREEPDETSYRMMGIILDDNGTEASAPATSHFRLAELQAELQRRFQVSRVVAASPLMERVVSQIRLAAESRLPVFLRGERGVGREYIARVIHNSTTFADRRFVQIDCEALSRFEIQRSFRRLLDQETEEPFSGTVLLKNIDLLSVDLQLELSRALQQPLPSRWMSTSRLNIEELDPETFDPALAAQLTPISIFIPPLRDRREDLPMLVQSLVEDSNYGSEVQRFGVSSEVEQEFASYPWPGNVSELVRTLEKAFRATSEPVIELEDLPADFRIGRDAATVRPRKSSLPLEEYLRKIEEKRVRDVLEQCGGNKTAAAEILGLPRPKLYRRLALLGIDAGNDSQAKGEET